jgi:hypothetical protein
MITMSALLFDLHESGRGHLGQVFAGGLRGDACNLRKLGRRQRAPVHQRVQHDDTRRLTCN